MPLCVCALHLHAQPHTAETLAAVVPLVPARAAAIRQRELVTNTLEYIGVTQHKWPR